MSRFAHTALLCSIIFATNVRAECEKFECEDLDSDCKTDFLAKSTDVVSGATCQYPLRCIKGKCVTDNIGSNCSTEAECVTSFYGTNVANCVGGKCVEAGNVGDMCTTKDDCFDGMECTNEVCAPKKDGDTCTVPWVMYDGYTHQRYLFGYSCEAGSLCVPEDGYEAIMKGTEKNGTCTPLTRNNKNCTELPCVAGLACHFGNCVKRSTVAEGGECQDDAVCEGSLMCVDGKCADVEKFDIKECSADSDCGTGHLCKCSPVNGHSYCDMGEKVEESACKVDYEMAQECLQENGCSPALSQSLAACAQNKCLTIVNTAVGCRSTCEKIRVSFGDCAASLLTSNCPLIPVWAKILLAFGFLVSLIAICFIVYCAYNKFVASRRSAQYDPLKE